MKPIDGDLFLKLFNEEAETATDLFDAVDFVLEDIPVLDVQPKVYSVWYEDFNNNEFICLNCKNPSLKRSNFCPNCGAIMTPKIKNK